MQLTDANDNIKLRARKHRPGTYINANILYEQYAVFLFIFYLNVFCIVSYIN